MGSEWREVTLGEFVRLQRGYDLPESQRSAGTIPVMGSAGLTGYHNVVRSDGPGVTIGRCGVGSAGVVSYCPVAYWPHNTTLYATDYLGNNPRFVYYQLQSMDLRSVDSGSAQSSINRNYLYPLQLTVPSRLEQDAIVGVLGVLDDKIAANRRLSGTLEALARRLFRSWFVDFDPVVAKAAGRRPVGVPAAAAKLFPAEFADSSLGPIPEGWRVGTVGEEFRLTMGQSPPGSTYNEIGQGLHFYQGRTDFTTRFPTRRVYCTAPTRFADVGDTLVSVRAPVGDINMAMDRCAVGRGLASVRHKSGSRSFTYYSMDAQCDAFAEFEGHGTLFGAINGPAFAGLKCVVPPAEMVTLFDEVANPMDARIETTERQSRTLAGLRDALLPRLLSGELRVRDAATAVGKAL